MKRVAVAYLCYLLVFCLGVASTFFANNAVYFLTLLNVASSSLVFFIAYSFKERISAKPWIGLLPMVLVWLATMMAVASYFLAMS